MTEEPKILKEGKGFHKKLQRDWIENAEGTIKTEKHIKKPNGRTGRIDIHVKSNNKLIVVVEIKNSNWDNMTIKAMKRNVIRQSKQVWNYINSQRIDNKDISPGIIFPKRPKSEHKLKLIEKLFEDHLISVAWEGETIYERRKRL